ncbi:YeeE/YedE family protein [Chloroflexota bacterium]
MNPLAWTGIVLGIVFGFALQRGRFCMNSAFRDIVVLKEYTLVKTVGLAILVEMIGFALLIQFDVVTLNPKPLFWGANIVGGLIFGVGMVLAGGCASGITYRVGEGMVGAMVAVAGFGLAGLMSAMGVLNPIVKFLQSSTNITVGEGASPTVHGLLGISYNVAVIAVVVIAIILWIISRQKGDEDDKVSGSLGEKIFKRGWGWIATGVVIGIIGIAAYPLSAAAGRNYPLGITGGWVNIWKTLIVPDNFLSWEGLEVLGIVVGAAIAALIAGEFSLRAPEPKVILQTFLGGFLMAFGAVCSKGCNVGHVLSGVPMLSIGSILGSVSIILGAWIAAYFMFVRPMQAAGE